MKKLSKISLVLASSVAALAGCALQTTTGDLATQAAKVIAFDLNLDSYVPAQLKLQNFTDAPLAAVQNSSINHNDDDDEELEMDDDEIEEKTAGVQLSEFQWAFQGISDHLNGLTKFKEHKNEMHDKMKGEAPFKRGGTFKSVVSQINYEVVMANGLTTLITQFDLGKYVVTQGTTEAGLTYYQGSYTNPYGGVLAFLATDDSLKLSFDPARGDINTFLSFTRLADATTVELIRYSLDDEAATGIKVRNVGVANFTQDYTYVLMDIKNNEFANALKFKEVEVYAAADATYLYSYQSFKLLSQPVEIYSYPLNQFVTDIPWADRIAYVKNRNFKGYTVDDVVFPSMVNFIAGHSNFGLSTRGKIRFVPHNGGYGTRQVEGLVLNILASEEAANGLPAPFNTFVDANLASTKAGISALITAQENLIATVDKNYVYVEVVTPPQPEDPSLVSSSTGDVVTSSESITSGEVTSSPDVISSVSSEDVISSVSSEDVVSSSTPAADQGASTSVVSGASPTY